MGGCVSGAAGSGLHALGAARRSLRAMLISSVVYVGCGVGGALALGLTGALLGGALSAWTGAALFWRELRAAMRETGGGCRHLRLLRLQKSRRQRPGPPHMVGRCPIHHLWSSPD